MVWFLNAMYSIIFGLESNDSFFLLILPPVSACRRCFSFLSSLSDVHFAMIDAGSFYVLQIGPKRILG